MSYSININKPKIEVINIRVTADYIGIDCRFYFEGGYMQGYTIQYALEAFDQTAAIAELKLKWNAINSKKQIEQAFRCQKPAAAYIDTPNSEFP